MSELTTDNPKAPKRSSKRKPAMEPLGWDEIVSQPGMGGYLSFLNGPVPLPHLQGPVVIPEAVSNSGSNSALATAPEPEIITDPVVVSTPQQIDLSPNSHQTIPDVNLTPGVDQSSARITTSGVVAAAKNSTSGVLLNPGVPIGQRIRIRRCAATHDGHSLGEEILYQTLWKAALKESDETRTVVIGWRGMSQLCRMTPKNCKINTQRLIRKLALEILSPYNTPESIGTTYRVYSDHAILQRRREAGLEWVVRSRGVEFVDPATGVGILPICAHTHQAAPP